jgi:hypothetical protein
MICIILDGVNNFPSTLHDSRGGKHVLFIIEVPFDLLISFVSTPTTIVPL